MADLALRATAVEGEHGFLVCRTISQVVKSCFQEIPAFCTLVAFAEQWAKGKGSTPYKDVTPEAADLQHKLDYGISISQGVRKRRQQSAVGIAKDLPWPLLAKLGDLFSNGLSTFSWVPGCCWMVSRCKRPQPLHRSPFSACTRAKAGLFVSLWHLSQQYQECKSSGTKQWQKCLRGYHGLFCRDSRTNQGNHICLH